MFDSVSKVEHVLVSHGYLFVRVLFRPEFTQNGHRASDRPSVEQLKRRESRALLRDLPVGKEQRFYVSVPFSRLFVAHPKEHFLRSAI